ncbi:hypothetical protein TPHA_0J01010 [Tetrapisispora phaffii CBS 4417]|uniref:Mitochondrial acidic protein MAM33 n=1 Tax=Tetrapisispora phaffii (strain ATCC 24235 / CBS 4417 / NBRC 1672 / NRRL Y-8282 / UCD 70-5) TaxID=1071381 RepID=G8BYI1_TETPH|nr:hypothetical protein TPHA_0J01010 [Tetrapisispora phaffii CBS 4417]CCE64923.1 hypothetical protein TPHA_0J01010 [Tetrapisispora phaffii CBS 4417]
MSFRLLTRSAVQRNIVNNIIRRSNISSSRNSIISSSIKLSSTFLNRQFSSSITRFDQLSNNVASILKSEYNLESDALKNSDETITETNTSINEYLTKYSFELVESKGVNVQEIVKRTDKETIRVFFDIAQVANLPYDPVMNDEATAQNENGESSNLVNEDDFNSLADNFANVNVVVTNNAKKTAVSFELLMNLAEGSFYVDSVTPFETETAALDRTADSEVKRELAYHGPPFTNLDEELQEALEVYLESRGITSELTSFITGYSELKENTEYISWLNNMANFFEK